MKTKFRKGIALILTLMLVLSVMPAMPVSAAPSTTGEWIIEFNGINYVITDTGDPLSNFGLHTTLNDAINNVNVVNGDTIILVVDTYVITNSISISKNITLKGEAPGVIIKADPASFNSTLGLSPANPIIYVAPGADVVFEDLSISGPRSGTTGVDGIYSAGSSVTLTNVIFDQIRNDPASAMQHGKCLIVVSGDADVNNCIFKDMQKNGIDFSGNILNVNDSQFFGRVAPVGTACPNAIVVRNGTANINNNIIENFVYLGTDDSCGIITTGGVVYADNNTFIDVDIPTDDTSFGGTINITNSSFGSGLIKWDLIGSNKFIIYWDNWDVSASHYFLNESDKVTYCTGSTVVATGTLEWIPAGTYAPGSYTFYVVSYPYYNYLPVTVVIPEPELEIIDNPDDTYTFDWTDWAAGVTGTGVFYVLFDLGTKPDYTDVSDFEMSQSDASVDPRLMTATTATEYTIPASSLKSGNRIYAVVAYESSGTHVWLPPIKMSTAKLLIINDDLQNGFIVTAVSADNKKIDIDWANGLDELFGDDILYDLFMIYNGAYYPIPYSDLDVLGITLPEIGNASIGEYTFKVVAHVIIDGKYYEIATAESELVIIIDEILNVKAIATVDGEITVSWDAFAGASYYTILCDGVDCTPVPGYLTSTEAVLNGYIAGESYEFTVLAWKNGVGNIAVGKTTAYVPVKFDVTAIRTFDGTPGHAFDWAKISWNHLEEVGLGYYLYYSDEDGPYTSYTSTDLAFKNASGLEPDDNVSVSGYAFDINKKYTVKIVAFDESPKVVAVGEAIIYPWLNVSAIAPDNSAKVNVSWNDVGAAYYQLYRDGQPPTVINVVGQEFYNTGDLAKGTYEFFVSAYDGDGNKIAEGWDTVSVKTIPGTIELKGVTEIYVNEVIKNKLYWDYVPENADAIYIECSLDGGITWPSMYVTSISPVATEYVFQVLSGEVWTYRLLFYSSDGGYSYSNQITLEAPVCPHTEVPNFFGTYNLSTQNIDLKWWENPFLDQYVTGYNVYVKDFNTGDWQINAAGTDYQPFASIPFNSGVTESNPGWPVIDLSYVPEYGSGDYEFRLVVYNSVGGYSFYEITVTVPVTFFVDAELVYNEIGAPYYEVGIKLIVNGLPDDYVDVLWVGVSLVGKNLTKAQLDSDIWYYGKFGQTYTFTVETYTTPPTYAQVTVKVPDKLQVDYELIQLAGTYTGQIKGKWDAAANDPINDNAESYTINIFVWDGSIGKWVPYASGITTEQLYYITGQLEASKYYRLEVKAYDGLGKLIGIGSTPFSDYIQIPNYLFVWLDSPEFPVANDTVRIAWDKVTGADHYALYVNDVIKATNINANTPYFDFTNMPEGVYIIEVYAYNRTTVLASGAVTVTVKKAPVPLAAPILATAKIKDGKLEVVWSDPSGSATEFAVFVTERGKGWGGQLEVARTVANNISIDLPASIDPSIINDALSKGYAVRVAALDDVVTTARDPYYSNAVYLSIERETLPLIAPVLATAKIIGDQLTVVWSDPNNSATGFEVFITERGKGWGVQRSLGTTSSNNLTVNIGAYSIDPGIINDALSKGYAVRVAALDATITSARDPYYSNAVYVTIESVTAPLVAPQLTTARIVGDMLEVEWNDPSGAATEFIVFATERGKGWGIQWIIATPATNSISIPIPASIDPGIINNAASKGYAIRVAALDATVTTARDPYYSNALYLTVE